MQAGSALAEQIQNAAQHKLMEIGWAPEESDTTLSEYVTMMLVNGKDHAGVQSELGGELLGVGEDDPGVTDFTKWLFDTVRSIGASALPPQQQAYDMGATAAEPQVQTSEEAMGDATADSNMYVLLPSHLAAWHVSVAAAFERSKWLFGDVAGRVDPLQQRLTHHSPSGPKAMRNGSDSRGRGRGGRMLGQMNRQMDRTHDDQLRKIKGAASGAGRIDAHANRAPRGPRNQSATHSLQRAMNGRGGHQAAMGQANPMTQNAAFGQLDPASQVAFNQLLEMQKNIIGSFIHQQTSAFSPQQGFQSGRGGRFDHRRGRGGRQQSQAAPQNGSTNSTAGGGMDIDKPLTDTSKAHFEVMCKYNLFCQNPDCHFAHSSPANRRPNVQLDMSDTCSYGAACQNNKCIARHPSPAQRLTYNKSEVECKFYPNCSAGASCPFKHPDVRPCRNGADCKVEACPFAHSSIVCRYNPCTRADCPYKHSEGQKRGNYEDKVWTANSGNSMVMEGGEPLLDGISVPRSKAGRFEEIKNTEGQPEELLLPGQQDDDGAGMDTVA